METLSASFPAGIEYAISFDTTKVVDASIKEVLVTLVVAIILVVLVTYLFLQNFRATLIPTIAIIVSVIGTFAGMLVLGFSLNLLTLLGLVLAIGIVCDDAIVVVENVERVMHEEKLNAKDATVKAMGEVIGPVIATTLVLCAVFIPVAFLGGTTGVLYKQFAVTIAISVSISSVVALTLTPALCGVLLKPRTSVSVPFRAFNWVLDTVTLAYGAGVRFVIRLAVLGLVLVAGIGYAIVYLFSVVPGSFVPDDDQGYVFAAVFLPDGATLNRTDDVAVRVERIFSEHPAVKYASKITGFSLIDNQFKNNAATIFVALRDFDERKGVKELSLEHLMLHARSRFATLTDGVAIPINPPAIPGLGSQGGFEFWLQNRGSDDPRQLASQVGAFLQSARERPELRSLNSTYNANARRLMIDVDRTRAETLGMPVEGIFDALQSLFGAAYVSQYSKYGRVWNVIVQAEASFRDEPGDIDRIFVRQRDGEMIPLSAVVDASYAAGPDLVQRFNGLPAAKITGDAAPGFSSGQSLAAMEATAAGVLPDTMSYAWAGQAFEQKQAGSTAVFAFAFGIVLVFLILAGQYERWTLPIAIITAVPFGVFGALVAVWISGRDNDVYFQVGLITLIGLSAKNAILIVEFAQVKHDQGLNAAEAAIEAAKLTPPDPHDLLCLHPRHDSPRHRHRCRCQGAAFHRHRHSRRHDRCYHARADIRADVLLPHRRHHGPLHPQQGARPCVNRSPCACPSCSRSPPARLAQNTSGRTSPLQHLSARSPRARSTPSTPRGGRASATQCLMILYPKRCATTSMFASLRRVSTSSPLASAFLAPPRFPVSAMTHPQGVRNDRERPPRPAAHACWTFSRPTSTSAGNSMCSGAYAVPPTPPSPMRSPLKRPGGA